MKEQGAEPAFRIENLTFQYPANETPVLKNINLTIGKSEFVVVTGPSGCGKSTLALTLNGYIPSVIEREMTGKVIVNGVDTKTKEMHQLAQMVGLVLQNPDDQLFALTIEEDVAFGPENLAFPPDEIRRRVDQGMVDVGIAGLAQREIFTLSGGQKQRAAIAGVLAMEPMMLVFDEPTSDLDPEGAAEILELVEDIRQKRDTTVVLVEHRLDEVSKHADRIIVMNEGTVFRDGPPRDVYFDQKALEKIGVRVPQVVEACAKSLPYRAGELPLSLDDAASFFMSEMKGQLRTLAKFDERASYGEPIVQFEGVYAQYPNGHVALRGMTVSIAQGEFVALVGQNGSGKSTFARLLFGALRPTKGTVLVDGLDVTKAPLLELVKRVGYVFQNPDHQIFTGSVEKELAFGPDNLGLGGGEVTHRVEEGLQALGLGEYRDRHPHTLSRGQRRRLAVASVLVMHPKILILDEPTTGQDYGHCRMLMGLAKELHRAGGTVIVITHDMRIVAEYCEKTIVLRDGRVALQGSTRQVFRGIDELRKMSLYPPFITMLSDRIISNNPGILNLDEFDNAIRMKA